jgi:hypothetical protein
MKRGQYVEHPTRPEWGVAEVVEVSDNKVSVNFQNVGLKILDISVVALRLVENAKPVPFRVNLESLEILSVRQSDGRHLRRRGKSPRSRLKRVDYIGA